MSDKTNAAQAGAAVPTTDADGRLDLHAVFRLQEECGYTRDLVLDAYSAQRLTGRLRGITALTGVLMAGDSLEVSLGEWLHSGLVEAIHHLTLDSHRDQEAINDRANKAAKKVAA